MSQTNRNENYLLSGRIKVKIIKKNIEYKKDEVVGLDQIYNIQDILYGYYINVDVNGKINDYGEHVKFTKDFKAEVITKILTEWKRGQVHFFVMRQVSYCEY